MWQKSQEDIKELVNLQKELLAAAIKCTNKNGIIIIVIALYSLKKEKALLIIFYKIV